MGTNTGTVMFFNEDEGFAFIQDDNAKKNLFVQIKSLIGKIRENDKVSYILQKGQEGYYVVEVQKAE